MVMIDLNYVELTQVATYLNFDRLKLDLTVAQLSKLATLKSCDFSYNRILGYFSNLLTL